VRVIVCGGRDYEDYVTVATILNLLPHQGCSLTIIHGGATGADTLVGQWAKIHDVKVEVYKFKRGVGGAGGPERNTEMLDRGADLVIGFPGGRGTNNMCRQALVRGVIVLRVNV
jgi:hypothetical protein